MIRRALLLVAFAFGLLATLAVWDVGAQNDSPTVIEAGAYDSLQAAFDALPSSGGLVRLPPGRFEIDEPLMLARGDVRLEGSGGATHIVNRNEQGAAALVVQSPKFDPQASSGENRRNSLWRVQLANFRISGNPKSGDGLLARHVDELYIEGLSIDHNGANGIRLVECYEDPRVSDSILTYNGASGLLVEGSHDIIVNANQFEENLDAVRVVDSFNLCMNGNNIDDHLRHGVVVENTYGSVISGNMIEECTGAAIILDRDVYGVTVSANVLAHNNGGGVDLRDAWGSTVSANTFTINPEWSLRIGPESGRITVTGNNFSNSFLGPATKREERYDDEWPQKGYARGVLLDGAGQVSITGNVFGGLIGAAVEGRGSLKDIVLSANVTADLFRRGGSGAPFKFESSDGVRISR
jgi:hypothetical protein